MNSTTKNYGAHSFGQPCPDIELQQRAIAAAKAHPLFQETQTFEYCEPVVQFEPKAFIARIRWTEEIKAEITKSLVDVERVIIVSFMASEAPPKPLCGGGKTFDFILHPSSMAILHAAVGTWRS